MSIRGIKEKNKIISRRRMKEKVGKITKNKK
jgi:hypothetical protein